MKKNIQNNSVQSKIVTEDQSDRRIDNYLLSYLTDIPKTRIYQMIRRGEVRVNSRRIKPSYRIVSGDKIRLPPFFSPPDTDISSDRDVKKPSAASLQKITDCILYEDEKCIVINKPSGLVVHSGNKVHFGLIECLRYLRSDSEILELVHRLDRETSGCLLIAKHHQWLRAMHDMLRAGKIEKNYTALLKGHLAPKKHQIYAPLRRNNVQSGERMVTVCTDGKPASSDFIPIASYRDTTLVNVILHTGRTHQIRVHAAHIEHPVAGDKKYGDKIFNQQLRSAGLTRLFLHASSLAFICPIRHRWFRFKAPLDDKLEEFLSRYKK